MSYIDTTGFRNPDYPEPQEVPEGYILSNLGYLSHNYRLLGDGGEHASSKQALVHLAISTRLARVRWHRYCAQKLIETNRDMRAETKKLLGPPIEVKGMNIPELMVMNQWETAQWMIEAGVVE